MKTQSCQSDPEQSTDCRSACPQTLPLIPDVQIGEQTPKETIQGTLQRSSVENTDIVKILDSYEVVGRRIKHSQQSDVGVDTLAQQDIEEIKNNIFDFDIHLDDRVDAFMIWHALPNDMIFELTNKLTTMYLFSGSSMIKEFLVAVINTQGVLDIIKIEFAKTIVCQSETKTNFDILDQTIQVIESTPIVLLLECIIMLMKSDNLDHIQHSRDYFIVIINNQENEQYFRYRTILSLEFRLPDSEYFITEALIEFLNCPENTSTYRILAGQALLQKYFTSERLPSDPNEPDEIYEFKRIQDSAQHSLLLIMTDGELDINVRADAADVLLNLGTGVFQDQARDIILLLGAVNGTVRSVYQDGQNIHATAIEKSALEILERLECIEKHLTFEAARIIIQETCHKLFSSSDAAPSFDDLFESPDESAAHADAALSPTSTPTDSKTSKTTEERMVTVALNRISIDRQLYSQYSISLKGILLRVLTFCNTHEHKDELYKRLIEELIDMHNKCSSGYAFRLINTLSGYCEHAIRISWADQISGNLSGRLNAMIRAIKDEDYQAAVMTELCLNSDKSISERKNFLQFLRKAIPLIREEMWIDFEEDMTDTEFDLYLRRAIVKYEGHEWL